MTLKLSLTIFCFMASLEFYWGLKLERKCLENIGFAEKNSRNLDLPLRLLAFIRSKYLKIHKYFIFFSHDIVLSFSHVYSSPKCSRIQKSYVRDQIWFVTFWGTQKYFYRTTQVWSLPCLVSEISRDLTDATLARGYSRDISKSHTTSHSLSRCC